MGRNVWRVIWALFFFGLLCMGGNLNPMSSKGAPLLMYPTAGLTVIAWAIVAFYDASARVMKILHRLAAACCAIFGLILWFYPEGSDYSLILQRVFAVFVGLVVPIALLFIGRIYADAGDTKP